MHHESLPKTILQGTLEGRRADIPAHARTAYSGLPWKRLEDHLCWNIHRIPSTTESVKGLNWTDFMRIISIMGNLQQQEKLTTERIPAALYEAEFQDSMKSQFSE